MCNKYIFTLFLSSAILLGDSSASRDILNRVVSKYKNNASFRVTINSDKIKSVMDVDRIQINDGDVIEKSRVHFIEPLDFSNVYMWMWSLNGGQIKKWITKPGSGKVIDITNKKMGLKFDFYQQNHLLQIKN